VAAALRALLGPPGAVLASLAALVSVWGYASGAVLQSPRLLLAMAERDDLPRAAAHLHPTWRTPDRAILVFAALSLGLALYGDFEWNAMLSAIVRLLTYGATCAAVLVLRARRPAEPPGFALPAAWLVAPAAVGFCLWLLSTRAFAQIWILALLMALGALLRAAARRGLTSPATRAQSQT
jgi:amino acid transporter